MFKRGSFDSSNEASNSKQVRRRSSIRTGCLARICIKFNGKLNLYEVYQFKEEHNHSLVDESDRYLLPSARGLNYVQEQAVNALSAINVGPVRAFNIMRTLYGGFDKVGATKSDFKNFKKDLNSYVGEQDADMLIKRFKRKKEYMPNFTFEFITSGEGVLQGLFWADEQAKRNYYTFGDVVSFDATYRRNKLVLCYICGSY